MFSPPTRSENRWSLFDESPMGAALVHRHCWSAVLPDDSGNTANDPDASRNARTTFARLSRFDLPPTVRPDGFPVPLPGGSIRSMSFDLHPESDFSDESLPETRPSFAQPRSTPAPARSIAPNHGFDEPDTIADFQPAPTVEIQDNR